MAYQPLLKVRTRRRDGQGEICITENGPGIPTEYQNRIFEPFFTTKPPGSGTGLGRSLTDDVVTQGHGGKLTVGSEEGHGATFTVILPPGSPEGASGP